MNLIFFYMQVGGGSYPMILIGAMIFVFWMFLIRPQAKKAKEQEAFAKNLEKGKKIVTIAGIHGTVNKVNEDGTTLQLEVSPGMYMKIEKSTISKEWTDKINQVAVSK